MRLYYAKISELSEQELQRALQLLPKERIEKIERIKQKKSQLQSIYAGLLLEHALREQGLSGKSLTFLKNPDGKPYIAEYPELFYNLSHSKRYVALVIDEHSVGVDVEGLREGYQKLVNRFFAADEIAALQEQWSDEYFTELWTRKESYLKATGYGMRMPLPGFSVLQERVQVNGLMAAEMLEDAGYYLATGRLEEDYYLSVCRKDVPIPGAPEGLEPEQVDLKRIL